MPDERREFHKIRPASHTLLSVNCLYQMNMGKRKGLFTKLMRVCRKRHGIASLNDCLEKDFQSFAGNRPDAPAWRSSVSHHAL
jgi:hypothetical protein